MKIFFPQKLQSIQQICDVNKQTCIIQIETKTRNQQRWMHQYTNILKKKEKNIDRAIDNLPKPKTRILIISNIKRNN